MDCEGSCKQCAEASNFMKTRYFLTIWATVSSSLRTVLHGESDLVKWHTRPAVDLNQLLRPLKYSGNYKNNVI